MTAVEKKINALADTLEDKEDCLNELRSLMTGADLTPRHTAPANCETMIRNLLLELGVPTHIKGYSRLVCAIDLMVAEPDLIHAVTTVLYPKVAELFDDTASRVERSIRHAIEVGYDRCDIEVLDKYFGNTVSPRKGKPTNSEFISNAARIIRAQM